MESLLRDLRQSARSLVKNPGFTLVVVLTLALGVGANTAIFSIVDGVLLQPLDYEDPDGLVMVWEANPTLERERNEVSVANFLDWREQGGQAFEELGSYTYFGANLDSPDGEPRRIQGIVAEPQVFDTLGVQPMMGRPFTQEDLEGDRKVIFSHSLWQGHFGGDPNIVGKNLRINDNPYEVVGVMPPSFRFPEDRIEAWVPLRIDQAMAENRNSRFLYVVGRLAPGETEETTETSLGLVAERLADAYPDSNKDWTVNVVPLHEQVVGGVRNALLIILATTGLVLLIAIANVVNLLLARAASRQKEFATRIALGAGRSTLIQRSILESLLLGLLGGLGGLLVAAASLQLLRVFGPDEIPRLQEVGIDARVLLFTLGLSILAGLAFGLIPAMRSVRSDLQSTLKQGRGTSADRQSQRLRSSLVIVETALALVLLIGAGLMIKSLLELQGVDPGFVTDDVLTASFNLSPSRYGELDASARFYEQLIDGLERLPDVEDAGVVTNLPLAGGNMSARFLLPSRDLGPDTPEANLRGVTPGYFETLGIPLLQGRTFERTDGPESVRVAIVNKAWAERFYGGGNPVGQTLHMSGDPERPHEIVGLVDDVRHWSLDQPPEPEFYVPYAQNGYGFGTIVVRSTTTAEQLTTPLREVVQGIDTNQPLFDVRTLDEIYSRSIARSNLYTRLLMLFAGLALILAAVGIYGVIAYSTHQRTREIGVRMALGAARGSLLGMILRQGLLLAVFGVGIGVVAAFFLTRFIQSQLYEVQATDPLIFLVTAAVLIAVTLLASYLPALRASRVDPIVVLREE